MTNKRGFTIIELMMAIVLVGFLVVGIMFAYLTCGRTFNSGQDRIIIRGQLSQAMDLMSRELYNAQSITSCSSTSLTFTANLGSGLASYTFALSGSNLVTDGGVTRATGIQTPSGSIPNIFTCSNGQVTVDITVVQNGESVRLQNKIMPRNMPMGLVAWWRFNEATSGTCSGAAAIDSSGNGNTGTCNNGPTWATGQVGIGAMSFNGSTQYVGVGFDPAVSLAGSYTISAWALSTASTSDGWRPFIGDETGSSIFYIGAESGANNILAVHFGSVINNNITGSYTLNDGKWHFITVVVVPSTNITVYYDGNQIYQGLTPGAQATIGISIARTQRSEYWKGSIDDLRIYNRALSASEISQLYNAGIGN